MAKKQETLTPEERLQAALVPEGEQPYQVPGNWCWTRIGDILRLQAGKNISASKISKSRSQEASFPCFGGNGVRGYVERYNHDGEFPIIGRQGALCGNVNWASGKFYATEHAVVVECSSNISKRWAYHILFSMNLNQYATATAQPGLSVAVINQVPIALPPVPEQQRIVDRIESLFAKLDEARQKAQDALDSFETRKAAILHKAFTGELTAQWRKEHGVGMESWRTVTFKDVCLKVTDGTHHSPVNTPTGEYMYVTAKNIKETGIDLTNITFVSKDVHDEIYSRCDVQYGDVLYIKDGATTGIATVNTIDEPFSLLSSVAVLRPDKKQIIAKYMVYNLNSSKTKAMMINNMSGNAITRLTLSKIKTATITVCLLDEQAVIVGILDDILAKEQQAKEAAEGVLEQIDLIKKTILARAFRGELGTNDPSEESAVELLKTCYNV